MQLFLDELFVSPSSKPTPEVLTEYTRKVDFLKGLLEAEKLVRFENIAVFINSFQLYLY